ncbi:MAG TPA: 30S ribosomal protein S12 methylthiotransferase RimO [Flexilinea sp.]|jgi:ribosomal protein S12 methylthiotransferase|nr:30S ribosomal protein S12 methylthiotransferase RimO [Flexilinea sp.]HPJ65675.1 30S ribosomal protein S12 methylthiotransferase RimO [Flexilinea sp.]HPR70097.1 30S ribosomal protein S12 methylthiotransferase RimO [Flexilinea sp.]HQG08872.1 30S ribosomal protein S12 methylthiotransferase RimO [Dysgonamonadaceae bacterium]
MQKNTFHLISLGCAKNTVDSNIVANILQNAGYSFNIDPKHSEYLIVNTCGFIQSARNEAIETLQGLAANKKPGQFLLAIGCMAELYSQQILEACPEVDGVLGTRKITDILHLITSAKETDIKPNPVPEEILTSQFTLQGPAAYLKIADGCGRYCSFCSIPLIKGSWISRPQADILSDAVRLQDMGIKELILIAQDTTAYGIDRGQKDALPDLIEKILSVAPDIPRIRVLYAFPGFVSDRLIDLLSYNERVLPYLDIPLQHAHPEVLKRMHRPADMDWVRKTIAKMRYANPDFAIRSTFIVGFPNETEEEFETLYDFLNEMKFDRVGVFPYSFEKGTASAVYGDTVPEEVKQERLDRLMKLQQGISKEINRKFIGKKLDVLIERQQDGLLIGRSYRDAPDIDGLVFVEGKAKIGDIIKVRIHTALEYDLIGRRIG